MKSIIFFLLPIVTWPRLRSTFKLKKKQKQEENMKKKKPNHFLDEEETFLRTDPLI